MNRDFNFEMANGFRGTMNNVNDIAQLVKSELLNTSNVVRVNGFRFSIGGAEGAEGYALYVETFDDNPNPLDRKCYVHKIYHLGKIRRGIDKYVADFLTLNAEYGMYSTPMFVWEDGKMVDYVELNNMEENEDIDYLVTIFNEKMVEDISKDFESTLKIIAEYGDNSGENEYVCGDFNYERDYENEWVEFYNENGNGGITHAYEIFRNASSFTSVDFFDEDDACELVYELGDSYGVEVEDNCCEECNVWVKNPYYVSKDAERFDKVA